MSVRRSPYAIGRLGGQHVAATSPPLYRALLFGCFIALTGVAFPLNVRGSTILAAFQDTAGFGVAGPNIGPEIPPLQILSLSYTVDFSVPPVSPCLGCGEPVP